ncbi:MAG: extracellular solute-binding protein [Synergistaceae bacterium]|nr:extracellular solute-binding protein [Synergistaceae bacterium]
MTTLRIVCAGSILKALEKAAEDFRRSHGDLTFRFVSGGSVELARELLRGQEEADLFFSADHSLLTGWFLDGGKASLVRPLVTNAKVLAFPRQSPYREELRCGNWYGLLERPGIILAHTAPDNDPGGYRTLLVLRLAELHYDEPGLFDRVLRNPSRLVLPPRTTHALVDRLHDEGRIDFMIRYRSSLQGERYDFLCLPKEIDLSDPTMAETYAKARLEIRGPDGRHQTVCGEPILYGAALLADSCAAGEAKAFLDHLFSVSGGQILRECGFGTLDAEGGATDRTA